MVRWQSDLVFDNILLLNENKHETCYKCAECAIYVHWSKIVRAVRTPLRERYVDTVGTPCCVCAVTGKCYTLIIFFVDPDNAINS